MARKYVEITIDEEGETTIEAVGYTDGGCRGATKEFEEAIGSVKKRKLKDNSFKVDSKVRIR